MHTEHFQRLRLMKILSSVYLTIIYLLLIRHSKTNNSVVTIINFSISNSVLVKYSFFHKQIKFWLYFVYTLSDYIFFICSKNREVRGSERQVHVPSHVEHHESVGKKEQKRKKRDTACETDVISGLNCHSDCRELNHIQHESHNSTTVSDFWCYAFY